MKIRDKLSLKIRDKGDTICRLTHTKVICYTPIRTGTVVPVIAVPFERSWSMKFYGRTKEIDILRSRLCKNVSLLYNTMYL